MLSDLNELPAIKLTDKGDYLRFELDSLTPFGREVAEKELRETPEIKKKAIEELRTLLQGKIDFFYIRMIRLSNLIENNSNSPSDIFVTIWSVLGPNVTYVFLWT